MEVFDGNLFDKWVDMSMAPAVESSLKLYKDVLGLGFKVFLLTGRSEGQRAVTIDNLRNAGFENWDRLILRYVTLNCILMNETAVIFFCHNAI